MPRGSNEPFDYVIDEDRSLVVLTCSFPVTSERWHVTIQRIREDQAYRSGFWFLVDRRFVHEPPTASYVERMMECFADAEWRAVRWANLFSPNDLALSVGRRMELLATVRTELAVRTFTEYDAAEAWLRRPGTTARTPLKATLRTANRIGAGPSTNRARRRR